MSKDKPSFKQQNLPAWQPILTASTVLPSFFLIGVAFIPIGIGLLMASNTVQEIIIDYTDCIDKVTKEHCFEKRPDVPCKCNLEFNVDFDYKRTVYAYYSLSNFYQNHRRYVRSRDDYQLLGHPTSVSKDCFPFQRDSQQTPIAPCGAIANSLFNDSFSIYEQNGKQISMKRTNIAWASDVRTKFRNPTFKTKLEDAFNGTAKPPSWSKPVWDLARQTSNNGFQNEDLIVWMRTAALPTFRKLYGILPDQHKPNDLDDNYSDQIYLKRGSYNLEIDYRYPVKVFGGRKRFILSDTSILGGKNHFLGIAYMIVGSICFVLSASFLFIHKKYGRLSSEIIQINQQTPYLE